MFGNLATKRTCYICVKTILQPIRPGLCNPNYAKIGAVLELGRQWRISALRARNIGKRTLLLFFLCDLIEVNT